MVESAKTKPPKTATMINAAAVTTDRPAREPCATASRAGAPRTWASRMPLARNSW